MFFEPVDINYNGAVLRTTAEISAKLIYQGNIKNPMDLRNLGKLLARNGFQQRRSHGIRKYVVHELQNTSIEKEYEINQIREEDNQTGAMGAMGAMIF